MRARTLTRKQFILLSAACTAAASLLQACSGDEGDDDAAGSCTGDINVMSSGDHQHSLLVTAAQIAAGAEVAILSGTTLSHSHYVKITAADFAALKAGMEVRKKSCAGGDHEYVLKCGGGASAPVAPSCSDECGDGMNMGTACG